jgi:hypothetical protein
LNQESAGERVHERGKNFPARVRIGTSNVKGQSPFPISTVDALWIGFNKLAKDADRGDV